MKFSRKMCLMIILSICCKIFKVCLTILGHYALKGEKSEKAGLYSLSRKNSFRKTTGMGGSDVKLTPQPYKG